jgi:hypothetical protein
MKDIEVLAEAVAKDTGQAGRFCRQTASSDCSLQSWIVSGHQRTHYSADPEMMYSDSG